MGNSNSGSGPSMDFLDNGSIFSGGTHSRSRTSRRNRRTRQRRSLPEGSSSSLGPFHENAYMVNSASSAQRTSVNNRSSALAAPRARAAAPSVRAHGPSARRLRAASQHAQPPRVSTSAIFGDRENDPGHIHTPLATREKRMMRNLHPHLFGEPSPVAVQTKVKVGNGEAPKFSKELNIISACVKDMEQSIS